MLLTVDLYENMCDSLALGLFFAFSRLRMSLFPKLFCVLVLNEMLLLFRETGILSF